MTNYTLYEQGKLLLNEKYKYVSPIQEGSFGKVTLAIDVETNTKYAMKAMYKSNPGICNVARHEIKMLSKLGNGNANICQLVEWFETDDFVILMLEYCANGDLYDLIHSTTQVSAVDIWHIAREMQSGLEYAHSLGIYHRDIKPENVLFTEYGQVKLCDWGLSTTRRYSRDFKVGSEKYMAPECFGSRPDVSEYDCKYSDYWSFGVTLLTAIFGTSPFKPMGEANTVEADSNYKHFVNHQRTDVLFDIYPTMNQHCFEVVMTALKVGGVDDDLSSYKSKIESRSLQKLISTLQNNWKFGLTIDEEDELEDLNHDDHAVFDMDDIDIEQQTLPLPQESENLDVERRAREQDEPNKHLPFPSLVESYPLSKSWCDFDEDDFEKIFDNLSVAKRDKKLRLNTIDEGITTKHGQIHIVENEIYTSV